MSEMRGRGGGTKRPMDTVGSASELISTPDRSSGRDADGSHHFLAARRVADAGRDQTTQEIKSLRLCHLFSTKVRGSMPTAVAKKGTRHPPRAGMNQRRQQTSSNGLGFTNHIIQGVRADSFGRSGIAAETLAPNRGQLRLPVWAKSSYTGAARSACQRRGDRAERA